MRLWPKSLAGQMVLLILIVLVSAQVFSFWFLADERKAALRAMGRDVTAERVESVLRLLAETPPYLHGKVTQAASGGPIQFTLDRTSRIPAELTLDRQKLWTLYSDRLRRLNVVEMRVAIIELDPEPRFWGKDDDDRHGTWSDSRRREWNDDRLRPGNRADHDRHMKPPRRRGGVFELSLRLNDGRWLNVTHHMPNRPFLWALTELLTLVGSAIALILIVVFMVRRITRPARRLAQASDALGRGEEVDQLPVTGAAEIRHATRAFNDMNQRLQRFMKDRLAILAALSHDLRTPITSLRLRAEFIEEEENREKILETLDEIAEMTEATLSFVREDTAAEETRPTDLSALVGSVVEDLEALGRNVHFDSPGRLVASCRPVALKRAIRNLVENAEKYGSQARVKLWLEADGACIEIEDDGPGIPEDQMEEVFQPFFRLESSRNRDTGGIGMGLAIARMIVRGHGGDIHLENRSEGGLKVLIHLPGE